MDQRREYFSPDYTAARARFRDAASNAGARIDSLELGAKGPNGGQLTIEIAWFGAPRPRRVLIHSSGTHGVEAFAGSAIQLQWLDDGIPSLREHSAVALVHVLNPFGMAWLRRFNENNVDLNRNFLGANEEYAGAPDGYEKLDAFLNPSTPPSADFFYLRAAWLIARYGLEALKQSVAGGQYVNPRGLFFGGARLEEGPRKLQAFMADRLGDAERITLIDVHTGLGPFAEDRLLTEAEPGHIFRAIKAAFGERVQSLATGQSVAYQVRGGGHTMYPRVMAGDQFYFVTQEFGTYNSVAVLAALREENRWHHYGGGTVDHPAKRRLKEVFSPDSGRWRRAILQRGRDVIGQAMALAFEEGSAGSTS
jgi:uncharacterized protein DUF2817